MATNYVKLAGNISQLVFGSRINVITGIKPTPTTFKLYSKSHRANLDCSISFNCNIRWGDILAGTFQLVAGIYNSVDIPIISIAKDKWSIMHQLKKAFKFENKEEIPLFNNLVKHTTNHREEEVYDFISGLAQHYKDTGFIRRDLVMISNEASFGLFKIFLKKWHKDKNVRELTLLGFDTQKVNNFWNNEITIKNSYIKNPYSIPIISSDIRENYITINPIAYSCINSDIKSAGEIYQSIYDKMIKSSWTGVPKNVMIKSCPTLFEHLQTLKDEYGVVYDEKLETLYLNHPYKVEVKITEFITNLMNMSLHNKVDVVAEKPGTKFPLDEEQKNSILGALNNRVCVITGGAGTGKSSTLVQLLYNLELNQIDYAVCSFTGKAVSRIRELIQTPGEIGHWVTSYKNSPRTMHKLILDEKMRREESFGNALTGPVIKCLVIDEASMISSDLFHTFINTYKEIERLILVGDCNQILPISWGSLFDQIIMSQTVPTYYLSKNYRTLNGDSIIINANGILKHKLYEPYKFILDNNFRIYIETQNYVIQLLDHCVNNNIKFDDIIILSPMNRHVYDINKEIQLKMKHNKIIKGEQIIEYIDSKGDKWVVGDRILITKNYSVFGVYNGDIGCIKKIDDKMITITINDEDQIVDLIRKNIFEDYTEDVEDSKSELISLDDLKLGYAITVNKAQGSEWKYVIFYVPEFPNGSFLNKNLFYTAITRAKSGVWVVTGNQHSFTESATRKGMIRCDNMTHRLTDVLPNIPPVKQDGGDMECDVDFEFDCDDFDDGDW